MSMITKPFILIVDDTEANLKILGTILTRKGYELATETDGRKALEYIETNKPDLILLDVMMPGMDGFEVCEKLKDNPETKDIPVIFLTARTTIDDLLRGFNAGGVDYINKPFKKEELLARVSSHLELVRTKKLLEESNRTKDILFSIIAHDLKNNMGSMVSWLKILNSPDEELPTEQLRDIIKTVFETGESTLFLLENLLDWSRDQRDSISITPENIDISTAVKDVLEILSGLIKKKKIIIENNIKNNNRCLCDKNTFTTIIRNLLSNAVKYTHENGTTSIYFENLGPEVKISIRDNGIGMTPETLETLFSNAKISSKAGTHGEKGTGLGLKLCKEFLELNNGKIEIESSPGKGSVFHIKLPAAIN